MSTQQQQDAINWASATLAYEQAREESENASKIADHKYELMAAIRKAISARAAVDAKQPSKFYRVSFVGEVDRVVRVVYNPTGQHSYMLSEIESPT